MSLLLLLRGSPAVAAPSNTALPSIAGTPRVGSTLTALTGSWSNNPTSYSFQWQSAATVGGTYTNIAGATSQSYVLTSGELNLFVRVVVTATNTGGSTPATANAVGAIQAALPSFTANLAAQRPTVILDIDFAAGLSGTLTPSWTDVTAYARDQLSIKHGRANVLDRIEAGTTGCTVDNSDRRFEPEYAASPYYPNVLPLRGLRLRAVYNGVIYPLHRGYVQGWPITWPAVKRASNEITSADGSEPLNAALLSDTPIYSGTPPVFVGYSPVLAAGTSGVQISTILDLANWPASLRAIDPGAEAMLGVSVPVSSPVSALSLIQDIADSEAGLFFFDAAGNAVFHDRDHRLTAARSTTVQATFGDGPPSSGELPYLTPETDFDVSRIYNNVSVASGLATPTTVAATDPSSESQYGRRDLSRTTILQTDAAAFDQATRILRANKDPHLRFNTITLDPTRDSRLWPVVLSFEISDRVKVIRRPYAGGVAISKEFWVEAVQHDINLGGAFAWKTTLTLSLADPTSYWTLDSSSKSLLDSTTVLR
jgi:hypothetical protein